MFYEPSEINAADKVTCSSKGCSNPERAVYTSPEEIELAMSLDPPSGRGLRRWINPKLAAIYVIGNDANTLFKIGYARDLRKRVLGIQGSCPVPVHLHHFVYVVGPLLAKFVEADVHEFYDDERKHGEWFDVDPNEVPAAIHYSITERGFKWWDEYGRRNLGFAAARLHKRDWERYSHRGHAHD